MAEEVGLDLVEIAPDAQPPVCKVMDFGAAGSKESDPCCGERDEDAPKD